MAVEPPRRISETPIIRREEQPTNEQRKKPPKPRKEDERPGRDKTGHVDIKI